MVSLLLSFKGLYLFGSQSLPPQSGPFCAVILLHMGCFSRFSSKARSYHTPAFLWGLMFDFDFMGLPSVQPCHSTEVPPTAVLSPEPATSCPHRLRLSFSLELGEGPHHPNALLEPWPLAFQDQA